MIPPALSPELQAIEREHRRGIRLLAARPLVVRCGIILAVVVNSGMLVFFVVTVVGYIISGSFAELRAAATVKNNIVSMHAVAQGSVAQVLVVGAAKVVQGTPTSYDLYATLQNPNTEWYATFTYTFHGGGMISRTEKGFVMPGEKKYMLALGVRADARPAALSVALENIVWHRVNRHEAPNSAEWLAQHGNFVITSPTYTTDITLATQPIGRTAFTVTNASAYSYWEPQFTVILERAGATVGIAQATVSSFGAGEKRDVEVRWYGELPSSATVTVVPEINYFDPLTYMAPQGAQSADPRE